MNIAIVTAYTPQIAELVAPISRNKQEYCDKWGYKFFLEIKDWDEKLVGKSSGFYKIEYVLRLMKENPDIDTFVWMDNDALITNFTKPLSDFIPTDVDLLIGEDWNGINVGVFFIKNNIECIKFLATVLWKYAPGQFETRPYWWARSEQCAISELCPTIKTYIVHHSLINGYIIGPRKDNDYRDKGLHPFDPAWQPKLFKRGDFVLHLAGIRNEDKPKLIEEYLSQIITEESKLLGSELQHHKVYECISSNSKDVEIGDLVLCLKSSTSKRKILTNLRTMFMYNNKSPDINYIERSDISSVTINT
jgi:hypothetical protein